mmetsp:Transcript_7670/g.20048  ORF Transcript_7670/g.20048 Transcript_7670/m.20048 type:complete len:152 (-) Transcript_7670:274-729(-)
MGVWHECRTELSLSSLDGFPASFKLGTKHSSKVSCNDILSNFPLSVVSASTLLRRLVRGQGVAPLIGPTPEAIQLRGGDDSDHPCQGLRICAVEVRSDGQIDGQLEHADCGTEEVAHHSAEHRAPILTSKARAKGGGEEHSPGRLRPEDEE